MNRLLVCLFLLALSYSHSSLAANYFVGPPTVIGKVNPAVSNSVKSRIDVVIKKMGVHKSVESVASAEVVLIPTIENRNNQYWLKLDRMKAGKVVASSQGTAETADKLNSTLEQMIGQLNVFPKNNVADNSTTEKAVLVSSSPAIVDDTIDRTPGAVDSTGTTESDTGLKDVSKEPAFVKHWNIGLGPVWSSALTGNAGTKMNVFFAYNRAVLEHLNTLIFYDGNFNTDTTGKSDIAVFGFAADYLLNDRLSNDSILLRVDAGYGGGNRNQDGGLSVGAGLGYQFFRTRSFTFETILHYLTVLTSNTTNGVSQNPALTQLRFGIFF